MGWLWIDRAGKGSLPTRLAQLYVSHSAPAIHRADEIGADLLDQDALTCSFVYQGFDLLLDLLYVFHVGSLWIHPATLSVESACRWAGLPAW